MTFTPTTIAALIIAASFAAGLNVYATVLTLGLLAHLHWIALPAGLDVLNNWWVISVSGAMFAVEFFADKVPGFDMIWNALHTFVRIPVAALLAYRQRPVVARDAASGSRGWRRHRNCLPRLKDRCARRGNTDAGTGFKHRPQHWRGCNRGRCNLAGHAASFRCCFHRRCFPGARRFCGTLASAICPAHVEQA